MSCEKIGLLCSRSRAQQRLENFINFPDSMFWTVEPFVTKWSNCFLFFFNAAETSETESVHGLCVCVCVCVCVCACARQEREQDVVVLWWWPDTVVL